MGEVIGRLTVALVILLAACGPPDPPRDASGTLAENGVTVTVQLHSKSDGTREIAATFTPTQPGFHLYSTNLSPESSHGLGIATRLDVSGDLSPHGQLSTDLPVRMLRLNSLGVDLPVYPDGPVTVTLPVDQTGSRQADAVVSYGACSETRCLMPVTDRKIPLFQ